ncbi:MAG: septation protein SepH [Jiangellaceae bacterium]
MRELLLVAMSENGTHLVLRAEGEDSPFALPIDERLHAAMRGDRARLGQLEIQMDSQLRPRDIQARVRAGESVESVAAAAAVPLDKVLRYAGPVIAEREHIAGRARRATVRRAGGEGPAPELDDAVSRWVGQSGADPDDVVWDAWRRDDGRWQVAASWPAGADTCSARFAFDPAGRSVAPDDDEARAISGERTAEPDVPAGPARLSVVGGAVTDAPPDDDEPVLMTPDEAPTDDRGSGDDPADRRDPADDEPTGPLPVSRRPRRDVATRNGRGERRRTGARSDDPRTDPWAQPAWSDEAADSDRLRLADIASRVEVDGGASGTDDGYDAEPAAGAAARRPASSRSRRPSVPSWDEIMFGRRRKPD